MMCHIWWSHLENSLSLSPGTSLKMISSRVLSNLRWRTEERVRRRFKVRWRGRKSDLTGASPAGWSRGPGCHILDSHCSPQSAAQCSSYRLQRKHIVLLIIGYLGNKSKTKVCLTHRCAGTRWPWWVWSGTLDTGNRWWSGWSPSPGASFRWQPSLEFSANATGGFWAEVRVTERKKENGTFSLQRSHTSIHNSKGWSSDKTASSVFSQQQELNGRNT